jgi:hypothetical protein
MKCPYKAPFLYDVESTLYLYVFEIDGNCNGEF